MAEETKDGPKEPEMKYINEAGNFVPLNSPEAAWRINMGDPNSLKFAEQKQKEYRDKNGLPEPEGDNEEVVVESTPGPKTITTTKTATKPAK